MMTKTSVKSGGSRFNHSQSTAGVKVQSNVKAGDSPYQGKRSSGGYVPT